jgi:NitT/TauT family transport system substrate-binding protein
MAALLSGEIQISQQGGSEALASTAGGASLVVLATLAPVYPYKFEVQGSIQSPADLKGKKVGVSSVGGSADVATRVALPKIGIDPEKDVTIVAVESHANRTAALYSGAIAGAVDDPPDSVGLEAKGLHPLVDLASLKLPAANTVVVVQRSWLNGHRGAAQKYVDSIVEAIARMKKDRAFTISVLKKYFNSNDDKAMEIAYDFFTSEVTPSQPYPRVEQWADTQRYLGQKNSRIGTVNINTMIDPSFVKSAVDRGLDK